MRVAAFPGTKKSLVAGAIFQAGPAAFASVNMLASSQAEYGVNALGRPYQLTPAPFIAVPGIDDAAPLLDAFADKKAVLICSQELSGLCTALVSSHKGACALCHRSCVFCHRS